MLKFCLPYRISFALATALALAMASASAQELPSFDFTQPASLTGWAGTHDISQMALSPEGLAIAISGEDPYFSGPSRDYPAGQPLWMLLRIKSEESAIGQVFFFQENPSEENSVHFYVKGGDWQEVRVPMPPLDARTRLRLDPPGSKGVCVLSSIRFEKRPSLREPVWPQPGTAVLGAKRLNSGSLTFIQGAQSIGSFELQINGRRVAVGNDRPLIGYISQGAQRWMEATNPVTLSENGGALVAATEFSDPDGARWQWQQSYATDKQPGGIEVTSRVTVSQDRSVTFFPMVTLLPGVGTFGTNKTQGVLAGVEYLENEASSSDADMLARLARRQTPDSLKLTFPLMALSAQGHYVGLIWEQQPCFSALHDSPDRIFHSGGHLMSVIFPGSDPSVREDGRILPYDGVTIHAGETLTLKATFIGGVGDTIVPAIQQYVARRGIPELPKTGCTARDYYQLAAHGWIDTPLRDGARYRHAVGEGFGSTPAADAALLMDWLSQKIADAGQAERLKTASREALAVVPPQHYDFAGVGHVRHPMESLVYGSVLENAQTALAQGNDLVKTFEPDGSIPYRAPQKGNDLASTHWSREANGLTAVTVLAVLERALYSGDKTLIDQGLQKLRALNKYHNTVPRGAQTWEVPLHTPDILASAYMLRVNLIGYELTGEADLLEQARYWAWTGVPFVYLTQTVDGPVGVYSTIAVFGATQFVSPVWIGLPVQWCGLVYGDAIRRFARYDPSGPWLRLSDGIVAAGIQHTHPMSDPSRAGLLPDSFELRHQFRNPVPINPATVMTAAVEYFGEPTLYDYAVLRWHGLYVHAPGPISESVETDTGVSFRVSSWPKGPWHVLISGCTNQPSVKINGQPVAIQSPHQYDAKTRCLVLQLTGPSAIELSVK